MEYERYYCDEKQQYQKKKVQLVGYKKKSVIFKEN
jgi:hypothetical protein